MRRFQIKGRRKLEQSRSGVESMRTKIIPTLVPDELRPLRRPWRLNWVHDNGAGCKGSHVMSAVLWSGLDVDQLKAPFGRAANSPAGLGSSDAGRLPAGQWGGQCNVSSAE